MTCPTCGKPELRKHRHGSGMAIRYGKFTAEQERQWVKTLVRRAEEKLVKGA